MDAERSNTTNSSPVLWIIAAFALLILGGLLIAETAPLILPPEASAEAQQVDNLFKILLAIGGAIFLLVQGALVFSVIRFRARPGDKSDGVALHGNATLEFVWTAIPAVIVLILSIISFQVWVSTTSAKDNEMVVNVTGARFTWSFSYAVPDHENLKVNSSTLHTYVGQSLKMVMQSADVNHAFYIPAMRIKQDLLVGRTTEIRFTPTLAGDYPVFCAELCGSGHGSMRARIVVHPDEATYLSWFDDEVNVLLNPPADPVVRGQQILSSGQYPCAGCHTLTELGWTGVTGPNQNGLADRVVKTRVAATGLTPEEYLLHSLYHPSEYLVPGFGNLMPQFQANDPNAPSYMPVEDMEAIVAYLCTLEASGENVCNLDNLQSLASQLK
ncbi:MAG: cytochrome c oxidase subunit II [Anaerolineae bacterium]|nr:cytochrome c oxidase subunit II [Anaerolineae bacterium]